MSKHSLSIAILLSTFFSLRIFSTNLLVDYDDQKEGDFFTQPNNQVQQPKQVCDYTILNNKNINHTLEDIEDVEDDLRDYVSAVNQKLVTTNDQSPPSLLGVVLQHEKTHEYHQYLITSTGLLSKSTQPKATKRAHKKGFHLIKATRGHVSLQLLEWLQISKYYSVTTLYTNRPVCHNCYLIANILWEKKLPTNEKGCAGVTFPPLNKMSNLAQKYINTHLNSPLVQNLVVPMMGYVSKEEMNKAIEEKDEKINRLNQEVNKKDSQLNDKNNTISSLNNVIKENQQKIADFQSILQNIPRQPFDDNKEEELFKAIKNNNVKKVKIFLYAYEDVVTAEGKYYKTPFLCAAKYGQLAIAKLFKDRDANIHAKDLPGDNALHYACASSGSVAMVTWLLDECKISIETKGFQQKTPFLSAVKHERLKIAKLLKQHGANIHATDTLGSNALHLACGDSSSVAMVTWLLDECKLGIETKGFNQRTPFFCAASKGKLAIAKLLKNRGANIHETDEDGNNALHRACLFSDSIEMVTWLLNVCKIGLETKGEDQMTPFLCSVWEGQLAIAKLLKDRGANIKARDKNGKNALKLAWEKEMISYLQSLGLKDDTN